jgi:hypothetical protein
MPSPLGLLLLLAPLLPRADAPRPDGPDVALARQYFDEARQRCADDGGRLWGRDLLGPLIFADEDDKLLVANAPDKEGRLHEQDGAWVGQLPEDMVVANTATDWAGVHWTMLRWPLPSAATNRALLLVHELYHHVQDALGLPGHNAVCGHLDTLEGRIWLQLEWRALASALRAARRALAAEWRNDEPARAAAAAERDAALGDALLFRHARRALLPDGAEPERTLEMNEGLAEYTGFRLCGLSDSDALTALAERMTEKAVSLASYARSFAYQSGPAWGLLLDRVAPDWRKGLSAGADLGELCSTAIAAKLPQGEALLAKARERSTAYDGAALRTAEEAREQKRQAEMARWRAALVDGPVLVLPLSAQMNYGFDPNQVLMLEGVGTVYPSGTLHDSWGDLVVDSGGMLLQIEQHRAHVTVPASLAAGADGRVQGPGWSLHLAQGWQLAAGPREGDASAVER